MPSNYTPEFLDQICYALFTNLYTLSKRQQQICLYKFYGMYGKKDHLTLLHIAKMVHQVYGFPIFIDCTWREYHKLKRKTKKWVDLNRMSRKMRKAHLSLQCDSIIYDIESANQAFGALNEIYEFYYATKDNN